MARGRAANYEEQHQAILQQAAELFALQGYWATSMNQVAQACGLSKPALYHYFVDKHDLLVQIAQGHVSRLQNLVEQALHIQANTSSTSSTTPQRAGTEQQKALAFLEALIQSFVQEYAQARYAHRVLVEDVKFMQPQAQAQVLQAQRDLVDSFAQALSSTWPQLQPQGLAKPTTMLLFGMLNWLFTWFQPEGDLSYTQIAHMVLQLLQGGVPALVRQN